MPWQTAAPAPTFTNAHQHLIAPKLAQNGREGLLLPKQRKRTGTALFSPISEPWEERAEDFWKRHKTLKQSDAKPGQERARRQRLHRHHRSPLIFSSYQSRQISQGCSIPYATGTETTPTGSRDLAEHQQLTPSTQTTHQHKYAANHWGWHLPLNSSFSLLSRYTTKGRLFQSHSGYWDENVSWESS